MTVACPWPYRGGWEYFNSHGVGTFVSPFNYRSRNKHRNVRDRQCVSYWWPLDWFGYSHNSTLIYNLLLKVWLMGCATCMHLYSVMAKGMTYGGLPSTGPGCSVTGVANFYLIWNVWYMGYCFYNCPHTLGCFRPRTFFKKKKKKKEGLD